MAEQWRAVAVEGFGPHYEVSDEGRVRSLRTGAVLRGSTTSYGYAQVRLKPGRGPSKTFLVHRLVAAAFHGPPPPGSVCDHRNGLKKENRAGNLDWVSRAENNRRYLALGPPRARLAAEKVRQMRRLSRKGVSYTRLAGMFGVSVSAAYRAVVGQSWRHVGDDALPANHDQTGDVAGAQ